MADTSEVDQRALPHLNSVERIYKLPVVEQTVDLASSLYGFAKDSNSVVKSVLSTAETTAKGAVDMTLPVTTQLNGPIKYVDNILCKTLDYVETSIPAVKLPPEQMYQATKDYVFGIRGVACACALGEQGVKKAVECACVVSEYSTQKLNGLKDSLAAAEEEQKKKDARTLYSVYLYTLIHVLAVLSSWVGLGKVEVEQKPNEASESKAKKSENNGKQANGTSHGFISEITNTAEGDKNDNHEKHQ